MKITLFIPCFVDLLYPQVGRAIVRIFEKLGHQVECPDRPACCGQPAFNTGYRDEARSVARHFLKVFRDAETIVVPSGSCTSMIAHHYKELFADEPERLEEAARLEGRVWEFSKFLTEVAQVEDVGARLDKVVAFHDSCHGLRELGIKEGPRRLLSRVRGLTLREMDTAEECCGFGGTFSVKFPEISGGMARTKIDSIVRCGAEAVVGIDASCLLQIRGALSRAGLPVETMHLAEVLAHR